MKLLVLAVLVLVVLALYFSVKAIQSYGKDKWKPDILSLEDGSQQIVITRGENHRPVVIHNIPAGLPDLEAAAERSIGWEDAEVQAKKWNK